MSNVVLCPICKATKPVPKRNRFFRCCGVLNSVKECIVGQGVSREIIREKTPKSLNSQKPKSKVDKDAEEKFEVEEE